MAEQPNVPAWLTAAIKARRLSVLKARGPVSSNAQDYVAVCPLDELVTIQNILASLYLHAVEDDLGKVDWNVVCGAANRLAHFIGEPVQVSYDDYFSRVDKTGP